MSPSLQISTYPYFRDGSFPSPAITLPAATLDLNAIDSPQLLQQGQSDQPPIPHPEHVSHSPRPTPGPDFRLPPSLPILKHLQACALLRCPSATSGTIPAPGPGHFHGFPSTLDPRPQTFFPPDTLHSRFTSTDLLSGTLGPVSRSHNPPFSL